MPNGLSSSWWSLVLRGLVGISCGIIAFAWPSITLGALVLLFGAYALIDGVFALIGALRASRSHERWAALLFEGISGIVVAVLTMFWPAITALALVYLIGAWALVTGVFEIAAAVRLRKYVSGEWLLALSGIASVIFGFLVMAVPLAGAIVIALWVGVYAFVFGAIMLILGFKMRSWNRVPNPGTSIPLPAR